MHKSKIIVVLLFIMLLCGCTKNETEAPNRQEVTTVVYNTNYATSGYTYSLMYDYLSEPEKLVYREIYSGLKSRSTAIPITGVLMPDCFEKVYKIVTAQEVEFYDLCATMEYSVLKRTGCVNSLYVNYNKDEQARHIADICIKSGVDCLKGDMGEVTDVRVQVRKIHNFIITTTVYDEAAPEADNIYGVFVDGRATCAGYAKTFKYLCDIYKIPCVVVTGQANGNHMWNYVKVGNRWYAVDTTWDDPDAVDDLLLYQKYCLVEIRTMADTHIPDEEYKVFED